jgi:hypothetical protein
MPVRRNVYSLSPNGPRITSLRQGIATMKSRPASDPTSWIYQANIHGTFDAPPNQQVARTWNQCQHGSFFFFSWHRMYLYFFERILQAASGNPNLALPYWNYFNPAQRALPVAFRQPADASNPLFETRRAQGINAGAQLPPAPISHTQAFTFINFSSPPGSGLSFGGPRVSQPVHLSPTFGALENAPHNNVHGLVGGSSGFMNSVNLAARDPIFWLHHSNIDRLWKRWLDQGGGRRNPVGNDVWMDSEFTFFDENGQEVRISGREILDTVNQLDYRYDDDPANLPLVPFAAAVAAAEAGSSGEEAERRLLGESEGADVMELGAEPLTVPVEVRGEAADAAAETATAEVVENRVVLSLKGIQYDENPGVSYEVYINLPEGQEPDPQREYFVGTLGFFGLEPHGHGAEDHEQPSGKVDYDITANVRALAARGEWGEGQISVTFIMSGLLPPAETDAEAEAAAVTVRKEPGGRPRIERVTVTTE